MRLEMKKISLIVLVISLAGCIGQAPAPQPTEAPTTSAPTLTSAPTKLPPTTLPPTTQLPTNPPTTTPPPKGEVMYWGNFENAPKVSDEYELMELFIMETRDNDSSDFKFIENFFLSLRNERYYGFTSIDNKVKLDLKTLDYIKDLNYSTKDAILKYLSQTKNNDTLFIVSLMKNYAVLYIGPDNMDYTMTAVDKNAVLNVAQCNIYGTQSCSPIHFGVGKGAWFFIFSLKEGEDLIKYMKKIENP